MPREPGLDDAAELFKVLGNPSRLWLLCLLDTEARTVGALAEAAGLSQPLVSQHLRTLRHSGLVTAIRHGKEVTYHVADRHVTHVVADALAHVREQPHTAEHHGTEPGAMPSTDGESEPP